MPDLRCASDGESINSLQLTYKAAQQITETLWVSERNEELKSFCASLMAYFSMIKRSLTILDDTNVSDVDNKLVTMLLAPIKLMFPASCFQGPAKDRLRELVQLCTMFGCSKGMRDKTGLAKSGNTALIDLAKTYESRDELLKSLAICEETLRDSYLQGLTRWDAEQFSPQLVIAQLPSGVSNAAQSMFEAMVACTNCPCTPEHDFGARLCLGTHRKPETTLGAEDEEIIDFDMFLSPQYHWQEVRVHASRNIVDQVVTDTASGSQSQQNRTEAKALRIEQLCKAIAKMEKMAAYRLELKVLRNQLFQLRPEICNSSIDTSQNAVSLEDILRHRKGSFTERTKRILAVILASTVFHLYGTPWLQSTWGSTDIIFFRTSSSGISFKPFINTALPRLHPSLVTAATKPHCSNDTPEDTEDLDFENFFTHPCPTVITLAFVLLEVYFETPFDVLAQKFNVKLGANTQPSAFTKYMDANLVFQACRAEIPQNSQFYLALTNCLDQTVWQDENGYILDTLSLRTMIYQKIISPLETELSQAYSSIPIEELDKFAQKLDFGRDTQFNDNFTSQADFLVSVVSTHGSASLAQPQSSPVLNYPIHDSRNGRNAEDHELHIQGYPHSAYTVGLICALPLELRAVRALFDTEHNEHTRMKGDSNTYALGTMGEHLIVAACLPSGEYGTNAAAEVASNMARTYPELEFCLLVGIGGGAPSAETDIRLGDVVVSHPTSTSSGVIQYDRGKEYKGNVFQLTGSLPGPPRCLRTAISALRSKPDPSSNSLQLFIEDITRCIPYSSSSDYSHPGQENDRLFKAACPACFEHRDCPEADSHVQRRALRTTNQPEIHYGIIASGNKVLKDAVARDHWAKEHGILCFEMEAAGVMNTLPCLVIRGICDYADSYKDKRWQNYAAATAAAYAKLLLRYTASSNTEWNTARRGFKNSLRTDKNEEAPQAKRQRA
ncbi:hypothetical protein H9Q72_010684 [Fusarium xylarioides]|uniref:Nucleoside phosphorylase domain-containing protein n=1 Tax=Fusarium xylarioides TaxID=221167 RepID=A0A9P7IGQ1_9HYPO|nr:hypothetical protein H9Q72_010684 [Fusarium xylarioides]KAG5807850.1 hypothetical protein H9Q71_007583 [Fusarium xylarioides]KAG5821781.1 hypothetical protein H9Q74_008053 [Fusarium xylarioides]